MSAAEGYPGVGRVLVIIPTYNEADNIRAITERTRTSVPEVDILITDDNSPDGTGAIADELAVTDDHIFVLHRTGKEGLGAAYKAGFAWAKDKPYDAVVEMDADGSHAPEELAQLLDALTDHDVVLGTRYIPGGSVHNWPIQRLLLSRGGNVYIRTALGMPSSQIVQSQAAIAMTWPDRPGRNAAFPRKGEPVQACPPGRSPADGAVPTVRRRRAALIVTHGTKSAP